MSNSEFRRKWLDRVALVAAATYSPETGLPNIGAAFDIGMSPILGSRPQAFEDSVNSIQFVTDSEYEAKQEVRQEMTPAETDAMEKARDLEEARERLDELEPKHERLLDKIKNKRASMDEIGQAAELDLEIDKLREKTQDRSGLPGPLGTLMDAFSGLDEKTGLNRTERKWLQAQANQDSDIKRQQDAELLPELRGAAADALESGEWTPELEEAYGKYQEHDATNVVYERTVGKGMENLESFYSGKIARPVSTFAQVSGLAKEDAGSFADDPGELFEAENWVEAWENSESVSPGQATTDLFAMDREDRQDAYEAGFDEYGNPIDKSYYNLRQSAPYSVISGTVDATLRWVADPLVIGGKAIGVTRAITRADWDRMPAIARRRMEHIATAPGERFEEVAAGVAKADLLGQRAIRLRRSMDDVTAKIRKDPDTHDETWLVEHIPAFKNDYLAAGFYRQSALRKRQEFDPRSGQRVDKLTPDGKPVFETERHELARAAMWGNGKARAELAIDKELEDMLDAMTREQLDSVTADIQRAKLKYEDVLTDPSLSSFQRFEKAMNVREPLSESITRARQLEGQLNEYETYHKFASAFLDGADATALRTGQFKPRDPSYWGERIRSYALRPSKTANVTVTATRVPNAVWRKRSHSIDLSGHGSLQEQAPRYLDQVARAIGGRGDSQVILDRLAAKKGFEDGFNGWRRDLLNRAARTRTDVERRAIADEMESFGIRAVATKHRLNPQAALGIAARLRDKRGELFRELKKQADENPEGSRFTWAEGNNVSHVDMPVTLTQLQNYAMPADLRLLDSLLKRHGAAYDNAFQAGLYGAKDAATEALEVFNALWKPATLFRPGYPVRTVSDESLRILAHTGSFQHLLMDMPKALAIGSVNTGKRVANRTAKHFPNLAKARGARWEIKDATQVYGKDVVVDGRTFTGPFAAGSGDAFVHLNSAGDSLAALNLNTKGALNEMRRDQLKLVRATEGDNPDDMAAAWLHVLNNQIANDPMAMQLLQGKTADELASWIRNTPEGRSARNRMPWRGVDADRWAGEVEAHVDSLVTDDVLRTKLANHEDITLDELRSRIMDDGVLSPVTIDEASTQMVMGRGSLADKYNNFVKAGYNVLARIPTDTLARNPFFNRQYRSFLKRQSESLDPEYKLTPKQAQAFERQAREFALKQTRRYLFNLADETDLVHYMRFISPFMGAWQESMRAWGRIMTENPEAFSRLYVNGWMDMDDAFFVEMVDQQGNNANDPDHGELDTAMIPIPKGMLNAMGTLVPGFDKTLDALQPGTGGVQMAIRKSTLNTTLQGDPFWLPGNGALVQLAAGKALGDMPELADENAISSFLYKYIFPVGAPRDSLDAILPTVAQRIRRWADGTKDPVFANTATLLHKSELYEWESSGRMGPRPDPKESVEKAKALQAFYVAGGFMSPFSFQLEPHSQLFVDAAHRYQEEFGWEKGYEKFVKEFGDDAYMFYISGSKSNADVPPTSAGHKGYKRNRALVDKYPEIGGAIIGLDAEQGPFSYPVYSKQRDTGQRESLGPEEAAKRAEATEGWRQWRKAMTALESELAARGLHSIQQKGAEDLAQMKYMLTQDLRDKYPGWSEQFDQVDRGKSYDIVSQFKGALRDGDAPEDIAWDGVAEYVMTFDTIAAELDARKAQGGSADIEAGDNADLLGLWNAAVGQLTQRNLAFADIHGRYLDNVVINDGSHGQKALVDQ